MPISFLWDENEAAHFWLGCLLFPSVQGHGPPRLRGLALRARLALPPPNSQRAGCGAGISQCVLEVFEEAEALVGVKIKWGGELKIILRKHTHLVIDYARI